MSLRYISISLVFLILPYFALAQTQVYKNYNVRDGLASSTVYFALSDSRGVMWFGTSQGLSRFDGTNFKNFTTRDGLPDNEVFRMAEDSMSRLWMIGYNSKPCYMYHDVIHNSDNDSLLKKIEPQSRLFKDICIDKAGRAWILGDKLYLVDKNKLIKYNNPDARSVTGVGYISGKLSLVACNGIYEMQVSEDSIHYHLITRLKDIENNRPVFRGDDCFLIEVMCRDTNRVTLWRNNQLRTVDLLKSGIHEVIWGYNVYNPIDSILLVSAGNQGIKAFDNDLKQLPDPYSFLPRNTAYSYTAFDREGNTWLSSLNEGVFFIPHTKIIQYKITGPPYVSNATSVHSDSQGNIYIGFDQSYYAVLSHGRLTPYQIDNISFTRKRIIRFCDFNKETIAIGADYGLYLMNIGDPGRRQYINLESVKTVAQEGIDSLLIGTINYAYKITKRGAAFHLDTIFNMRTTAIAKDKSGKIWLGSLDGLYVYENGKAIRFSKNKGLNKSRITDLLCDDYGNIWVGTNQRGVYVITKDSIYCINSSNGLPSDMCTRILNEGKAVMWICTNRNVSRLRYEHSENFAFNISTLGDLFSGSSVSVNDVAVDSANIWIASNEGMYKVQKGSLIMHSALPVYITSFHATNPDSFYSYHDPLSLKYNQNNVQIDYIGISYSGGKVIYKYLMNKESTDTFYTTTSTLNFSSLSPGRYSFRIWAKNLEGNWSIEPAKIDFEILAPFWRSWWFILVLSATAGIGVLLAMRWRISQIRARELEKTSINKKISEIELQALRAQMNEHFIFNSLNSIQNFINQNNTEAASFYLASFGKLIRKTMDLSRASSISLRDEIDYLDNYLTLEKMRFGNKFDYLITNEIAAVSTETIIFPSMILQPYVENSIRHGLRHKTNGKGELNISFSANDEFIICRIEDNGVGRKRSEELKSKLHIEYQSRGTKLSEDKVYLYNQIHNDKVRIEVEDKINAKGDTIGTIVNVYVPFKTNL